MKLLHGLTLVAALFVSACTSELTAAGSAPAPPEKQVVRYRLIAVPLEEASPPTQKREPPPLQLRGRGSMGRIVDANGNIVMSAVPGKSIYGLSLTPDQKKALIYFGDAENSVVSVDRLKTIAKPPTRPDAPDDATGFSWFILDDDHLIGQADLPSLEPTEGLTASEADGLPPRGTLVYIYTITTDAMTPVEIDDSVPRPFGISTDSYGNLVISPLLGLDLLGMKVLQIPEP